jgi:glycosyltransferase involved in cell wall biosynthesis
MRVLQIYNRYRSGGSGETTVVNNTIRVLEKNGHEVRLMDRDSAEISSPSDKLLSAITGVYSFSAERDLNSLVRDWRPDVVHAHNLYPLLTPSVLRACTALQIPVVMTVHNYGLTCPIQTHVRNGVTCTECVDEGDHRCVVHNCRGNLPESIAYAGRHGFEKTLGLFRRNVTFFLPVSAFVDSTLRGAKISASQTRIMPNGVTMPTVCATPGEGKFALFVGRFIEEKGIIPLLEAAKSVPNISFRFYGDGPLLETMRDVASANVSIMPWVTREALESVYREARCVVVPSLWNDPCPMSAIEALGYGLPVLAARVGGLPTLIENDVSGLLVAPGSSLELSASLTRLFGEAGLAERLGKFARQAAEACFSENVYYKNLISVYQEAILKSAKSFTSPET